MDNLLKEARKAKRKHTQPRLQYPVTREAGMSNELLEANCVPDQESSSEDSEGQDPKDDVDMWLTQSVKNSQS